MKIIEKYQRAVETGDEALLKEVFAPQVRVDVPAGPSVTYPATTASYILSQVARTAPGIKCTLTAGAGSHWYLLGFEGELEGRKLQAIDQLHLNSDGKIDQLIIYMRPLSVAQTFADAVGQRLQATT